MSMFCLKDVPPMTENTINTNASTDKDAQIAELETLVEGLQAEVNDITSERDRLVIESKLAIEDAELARSFSKKNYSSLLIELFETPKKQLKKSIVVAIILSAIISGLLAYASMMFVLTHNKAEVYEQLNELNIRIEQLSTELPSIIQEANQHNNTPTVTDSASNESPEPIIEELSPSTTQDAVTTSTEEIAEQPTGTDNEESEKNTIPAKTLSPEESAKLATIERQTVALSNYLASAKNKTGFPADYATNETSFAQLYLIIMQHASNEKIYYESYLNVINDLNISATFAPKNVDDLVKLDRDFLQAAYSAFIITSKKQNNKWRYREIDRKFSSYYSNDLNYDLGDWQVVNETQDYQTLPTIFALNIQRMMQQFEFNNQLSALQLPATIYYEAYAEANKNNAVTSLLNRTPITNQNGTLTIDTSDIAITLNQEAIVNIQKKLAAKNLMSANDTNGIAGPKTAKAISAFKQSASLPNNSQININLLKALEITPRYSQLKLQ